MAWPGVTQVATFRLALRDPTQTRFPGTDWWSHDAGHFVETMFG
tara:strand:+ start:4438 stop:4569 length:132 start_codon:yes stop_codon:yes gene_type:complete